MMTGAAEPVVASLLNVLGCLEPSLTFAWSPFVAKEPYSTGFLKLSSWCLSSQSRQELAWMAP